MTPNRPTSVPPTLPPYGVLADLYAKGALHRTPYSALPDAPVLPYVEPRRRLRRVLTALSRTPGRLPSLAITRRNTRRQTECSPS
jgi:hypothetical protein